MSEPLPDETDSDQVGGAALDPTVVPPSTRDRASVPARAVQGLFEKALVAAQPLVDAYVERLRLRYPNATPAQLVKKLEVTYVSSLTVTGLAVGAVAAVPGAGTAAAVALTAGDLSWFFTASAVHVLSVLRVHGVELTDLEHRKAVVLTVLVGTNLSGATNKAAERTAPHLGKLIINKVPIETINRANKILGPRFITKFGTKQGVLVLGRAFPFGIGAAIGAGGNFLSAQPVIKATQFALKEALKQPEDLAQDRDQPAAP